MKKVYGSAAEALDGLLFDGMTIAAGGFGLCGIPELLIAAIREAMLAAGRPRIAAAGLAGRVSLYRCHLPRDRLPRSRYDAVISNSLLHHLGDPAVLWQAIEAHAGPGAPVFVMDLLRPESPERAQAQLWEQLWYTPDQQGQRVRCGAARASAVPDGDDVDQPFRLLSLFRRYPRTDAGPADETRVRNS